MAVRSISSLAYVPEDEVQDVFFILQREVFEPAPYFDEKVQAVLTYFRKTYVGIGATRATFHVKKWNKFTVSYECVM